MLLPAAAEPLSPAATEPTTPLEALFVVAPAGSSYKSVDCTREMFSFDPNSTFEECRLAIYNLVEQLPEFDAHYDES